MRGPSFLPSSFQRGSRDSPRGQTGPPADYWDGPTLSGYRDIEPDGPEPTWSRLRMVILVAGLILWVVLLIFGWIAGDDELVDCLLSLSDEAC